jgi:hypothetical protein
MNIVSLELWLRAQGVPNGTRIIPFLRVLPTRCPYGTWRELKLKYLLIVSLYVIKVHKALPLKAVFFSVLFLATNAHVGYGTFIMKL